jgi:RimJ/RimL family protein N-acetyltransferase
MELRLQRCRIRPWVLEDLGSMVRHANNRNVSIQLRDRFPYPYTEEAGRSWIEHNLQRDPATNFAIEVDGEAAGGIGIVPGEDVNRLSAEIGYWLGEEYWGRGIVTEAVRAFTAACFERFDLLRIHADVFDGNTASMRVLEKCGYVREGTLRRAVVKDGRVLDQIVYAIIRESED